MSRTEHRRTSVGAWCLIIALLVTVSGCASTSRQAAPAQTAQPAVLRLLDISPPDGSRVDSSTVIVARLAYHIPDFDPNRRYVISALFAQVGGRLSSTSNEQEEVRSPFGIVTLRRPVAASRGLSATEPATPLTGVFFLLRHDSLPTVQDTIAHGDRLRVRTLSSRSTVRARSRTFYYNGAGPARNLSAGLLGVLEDYWTYRPHKALAISYESAARWTYGYAFGFRAIEDAIDRALEECRAAAERRQITAPCRLVASDDQGAEHSSLEAVR